MGCVTSALVMHTRRGCAILKLSPGNGDPAKHFTGAIFAERFEAISRGRFFVGNISVTYTKGTGYRLILKAEDGNRLLEVTERDTIGYDRALIIVSEWMNHPANRDRLPKANR